MNEQLQAELTKIITNINNGAETAWGFINEQTPDVIQQLLYWHGIKSFIFFSITIMFLIAAYIISIKLYKYSNNMSKKQKEKCRKKDYEYYDGTLYFAMWFVPLITTIFLTPIAISENIEWLKIWIAPKVWVLEYIANIVK